MASMVSEVLIEVLKRALEEGKTTMTQDELCSRVAEATKDKAIKMMCSSSVPGFKTSQNEDGSFTIERAFVI